VALLSIDLAKNIFQPYDVASTATSRRVSRNKDLEAVVCLPCCRIVVGACGVAHYWARRLSTMGHQVQVIAPRSVKPFVKSQKNDRNDAEVIVEAASQPTMRYVAVNSVEQQDIQFMHRIRSLLMRDRGQDRLLHRSDDYKGKRPRCRVVDGRRGHSFGPDQSGSG
jgi:transposase